ncbi:hypothetical protein PVL29_003545 [Vitis rotundifolia]|uniref:Uncharacterized protein n=1 Tax=Vitis rotundifolia TaxID=103349 RepID=A0AA39ADD5_VITRO|nr:hypothetical protein PVL29_003545 [Vitis rotundifolia]
MISLLATVPTTNVKKESSDASGFGNGQYKFWALATILLLTFWSMFTGTITLWWREKVVKHTWDVYINRRRGRLPRFRQEAQLQNTLKNKINSKPGMIFLTS